MAYPTYERLKYLLSYDELTGVFRWNSTAYKKVRGKVAGTEHQKGYRKVFVDGCRCYSHRLAWFYVYGVIPIGEVDHIDGDPSNNRISNLRDVTKSVNMQNRKTAKRTSKCGYLGVSWSKRNKKWIAQIALDGKKTRIGGYDTAIEAYDAYLARKREIHEGCTI